MHLPYFDFDIFTQSLSQHFFLIFSIILIFTFTKLNSLEFMFFENQIGDSVGNGVSSVAVFADQLSFNNVCLDIPYCIQFWQKHLRYR